MAEPVLVENTFDVTPLTLWNAITDKEAMKVWYFGLEAFNPEVGFTFSFEGGNEHARYMHDCMVTEVVPLQILTYSWAYRNFKGMSYVTWQLFPQLNTTRLVLTHSGLDSFPEDVTDFARQNFVEGWNYIIGSSLKNYLEKELDQ